MTGENSAVCPRVRGVPGRGGTRRTCTCPRWSADPPCPSGTSWPGVIVSVCVRVCVLCMYTHHALQVGDAAEVVIHQVQPYLRVRRVF